jgi:tRNA threonylcarbamoyladenosine biosynthesis protein TsaE
MSVIEIKNEQAMLDFGKQLALKLDVGLLVYLVGDLGAGKTTLVRGVLRGMGYEAAVKSPTYNIVENYALEGKQLYHFDLYRIDDPEELEYMGIRDYLGPDSNCFVEWTEKGEGVLPEADVIVQISIYGEQRKVTINFKSEK